MKKNLFISGGEVLRVTKNGDGGIEYLICDDDVAMREVDEKTFVNFMNSLSMVCFTSWNKQLGKDYKELEHFFEKPYYIFEEFYGDYSLFVGKDRKPVEYRACTPLQACEMFYKEYGITDEQDLYSASMDIDWAKKNAKWESVCEDYEITGTRAIEI